MKYLVLLLFVSVLSLTTKAQQKSMPFIDEHIQVDGKLDEKAWNQAEVFTGFHNFYPIDEGLADNNTVVKVFHDGENIYISAVYHDTTSRSKVSTLKRDGHGAIVVRSDAFGVILDTYNKKNNGYYFIVNAGNAQLDALLNFNGTGYSYNDSWNTIWESQTSTEGTKKIYEIKIPFKSLSFDADNTTWGLQFFVRDFKINRWMTYTDVSRNFIQFDMRHTESVNVEQLPDINTAKFTATPSITYNYQKEVKKNSSTSRFKPSLDAQYRLTSSLKLDATINPDFSQIDVDQQVTNLTRFAVNFPERRNFFIENSDLFTNLGTDEVNPFYSRRIGATNDILFGVKLSGNVTPKTRIGLLNVQTDREEKKTSQNYGAMVVQQQLSSLFTTTGFIVNRQGTKGYSFQEDYNRVAGLNINYKSTDNIWTGVAHAGRSFSKDAFSKNHFYNVGVNYSTKKILGAVSASSVGKNYLTDIGFVPRLYNYDAMNNTRVREGYARLHTILTFNHFPENPSINQLRYLRAGNTTYLDEYGNISQSTTSTNHAIFFNNSSSAFVSLDHTYVNLKYGFDPLRNGSFITPDVYNYASIRAGYNSPFNRNISFRTGLQYGSYYGGRRTRYYMNSIFRFLPIAKIGLDYELNHLDLHTLGNKSFHLARLTKEIFFSNCLNWTTYIQYNTQSNNFNINSRLQWEYKPLSYVYLVVSDNYNQEIDRTNWGVAFKMNYRFDF